MISTTIGKTAKAFLACALLALSGSAAAHVWTIGWKAAMDGSVTMYGLSYHTAVDPLGYDDFTLHPAGFVINGTNVSFDLGSVVDLGDCFGPGAASGTCDPTWNALGLDGAVVAQGYVSEYYGKYATAHLTSAELAALGIGTGSNSVLLSTYADNIDWEGLTFESATVPINIVVPPPTNGVPEPGTLALLGMAALTACAARRRQKQTVRAIG